MKPLRFATFRDRYPVPLADLLMAPLLLRDGLPFLLGTPAVNGALLRDVAMASGYRDGAVRTAMSRLRTSEFIEERAAADGSPRFHLSPLAKSVQRTVADQLTPKEGYTLVVFAFATENVRERHVVREALRLHGFHRIAQNTYLGGAIDMTALDDTFVREGVADNVFAFRSRDALPENARARLAARYDLVARARALRSLQRDLRSLLDDDALADEELAHRLIYAAPVHYRVTFTDEPQLPSGVVPEDYPLQALVRLLPELAVRHAEALVRYFSAFVARQRPQRETP